MIDKLMDFVQQYLYLPYLLTFLFSAYLFKKQLKALIAANFGWSWKMVYVCLVWAAVLAVPFVIFTAAGWERILLTYFFATSLHETLIKRAEEAVSKRKGAV